jgi:archaellum component FlaC
MDANKTIKNLTNQFESVGGDALSNGDNIIQTIKSLPVSDKVPPEVIKESEKIMADIEKLLAFIVTVEGYRRNYESTVEFAEKAKKRYKELYDYYDIASGLNPVMASLKIAQLAIIEGFQKTVDGSKNIVKFIRNKSYELRWEAGELAYNIKDAIAGFYLKTKNRKEIAEMNEWFEETGIEMEGDLEIEELEFDDFSDLEEPPPPPPPAGDTDDEG